MQTWTADEFTECLREVGRHHYHDRHPFHRLMNEGLLDRGQIRLWVANPFYYQQNIPIKDALLLACCPLREVRRRWVQRILDHDGWGAAPAASRNSFASARLSAWTGETWKPVGSSCPGCDSRSMPMSTLLPPGRGSRESPRR